MATIAPRIALLRALAEERSVTRAAERLDIPQPTASRWLAGIAADLGLPLVAKSGRGITLTSTGRRLAESADRALAVLESGWRQAIDEADPERGLVVLGFLHTMGGVRVPELLRGFRAEHPRVRFELTQGAHDSMLDRLRRGEIDLVLTAPLPAEDPALATHELYRERLVLVVGKDHRLAGRGRVRLSELAGEQFVGLAAGYGLRRITDALLAEAGVTPRIAFQGEEVDTLRGLVAAGLGVALLPSAEPAAIAGTVELPLWPKPTRRIGLVWMIDRPLTPAARSFRDYAITNAAITNARR